MIRLAILLSIVAGLYGCATALVWVFQDRLLYLPNVPSRSLDATPANVGLAYDTVDLVTPDGVRLHGWFVPAGPDAPVILRFHGNAGNISHRVGNIRLFNELGLSVMAIDYRGYGLSEGKPDEPGTYIDGLAAFDWVVRERGVPADRIVVAGRSLGAAVAIHVAANRRCAALVSESAFTSVPDVAAEHYRFLPVRLLSRIRYDNLAAITGVEAPLLLFHSRDDEVVPYAHAQRLRDASGARLITLSGGHNEAFLLGEREYMEALQMFFADIGLTDTS